MANIIDLLKNINAIHERKNIIKELNGPQNLKPKMQIVYHITDIGLNQSRYHTYGDKLKESLKDIIVFDDNCNDCPKIRIFDLYQMNTIDTLNIAEEEQSVFIYIGQSKPIELGGKYKFPNGQNIDNITHKELYKKIIWKQGYADQISDVKSETDNIKKWLNGMTI